MVLGLGSDVFLLSQPIVKLTCEEDFALVGRSRLGIDASCKIACEEQVHTDPCPLWTLLEIT